MKKKLLFAAMVFAGFATFAQQGVGINELVPGSKLSVNGNLAVGSGYSSSAAPADGAIIQGSVGIGTLINTNVGKLNIAGGGLATFRSDFNQTFTNIPTYMTDASDATLFTPTTVSGTLDGQTIGSEHRLYVEDDADDVFGIWGGSCAGPTCYNLSGSKYIARFFGGGKIQFRTLVGTGKRIVATDANGVISTAIAGTDYQSPVSAGTGISLSGNTINSVWTASGNDIYSNNSGAVGIGTTSASQKLMIGGNGGIGFIGASPSLNPADKKIYSPADGDLEWMTNDFAGVHGFAVSHAGTKRVYLNTSGNSYFIGGNVGIGTSGPNYLLEVASSAGAIARFSSTAGDPNGIVIIDAPASNASCPGNGGCTELILFTKAGAGQGSISFNAGFNGVLYNTTSDKRLKENIKNTRYGIEDLMKVNVVDYNFIGTDVSIRETGFLAQDLFKIYPNAVKEGDYAEKPENIWAVDYGKVTPLLVKAVQDQQKEIANQQARIDELEKENAELKSTKADVLDINKLKAQLDDLKLLMEKNGIRSEK